jgi:hypothetical protein
MYVTRSKKIGAGGTTLGLAGFAGQLCGSLIAGRIPCDRAKLLYDRTKKSKKLKKLLWIGAGGSALGSAGFAGQLCGALIAGRIPRDRAKLLYNRTKNSKEDGR